MVVCKTHGAILWRIENETNSRIFKELHIMYKDICTMMANEANFLLIKTCIS